MGEIFANDMTDKELIQKIYDSSYNSTSEKQPNHIKEWAYDLNRHLPKEDIQRPTGM